MSPDPIALSLAGLLSMPSALMAFERAATSRGTIEMTLGATIVILLLGAGLSAGYVGWSVLALGLGLACRSVVPTGRQSTLCLVLSICVLLGYAAVNPAVLPVSAFPLH